ncbi:hypothetical protein [Lactococcus cremoris]|uniref:Uncharacterized protein n=1 Tax=Lactococcus lactis subsp. cremoris TaxID=1359 RepID=A0AAX4ADY3_LACLC|nr:hypothetical protein [Lactococcus cremoris]WMX70898.1 hypothetical protein RF668_00945 [Lactococcus cremoris]
MKKLHWKISLVLLTVFLLIPYAGEFSILKVKADETGQTEISSSSSATSDAQSSEVKNSEQKQAPTEPTPPPSFTGTLNDMIDQVYPSMPIVPKPSPKSFVSDDGVTINGQFYSNAEFDALLDKMTLAPNAPEFTVDANGQIHFDYDLRIFPLAAPIFVAALPIIGKVFVTGATIIVGGLMINENNKEWNKVTSRLNAAQRAKVEAEKAKAKAKAKPKSKTTVPNPQKPKKPNQDEKIRTIISKITNKIMKNGKIDISKFTQKVRGTDKWRDPKTDWEIDKSNTSHKGDKWKLNNPKGKRIASITADGRIVGE